MAEFLRLQVLQFLQAFAIAWVVAYGLSWVCRSKPGGARRHAVRRGWDLVAVGVLAAGLAAGISWLRPPLPAVHDEFSYLLAADTFSHGRLTNPTHPLWEHFETPHEIQQPTYASKYPPGQGLILALGQVAAGDPIVGLWISAALAAGAATWMLQGWMPQRWALLGGVLAALHPGLQLIWTQGFWGGNVAFTGGALVLGAYARLRRTPRCRDAVWLALGLAILANSRPFEGAVASLPVALAMLSWLVGPARDGTGLDTSPTRERGRGEIPRRRCGLGSWPTLGAAFRLRLPLRVVLTLGVVLAATAVWMAYYNWRVTGHPCKMPYVVHEETYGAAPFFLWQSAGPMPEYRHARIARLHGWLRDTYLYQRTWSGFVSEKWISLVNLWYFFLGLALSIPLLALPWVLRKRRYWLPAAIVLAVWGALLTTTWVNPHYFAPAGPALLLLVVQGLRHLRVRTWRRAARRSLLTPALVLAQLIGCGNYVWFHVRQPANEFAARRAELVRRLEASPGRHLVIVQYSPESTIHLDWVHNAADIDAASIVWARSMSLAADRRLVEHFHDRHIWRLRVDAGSAELTPYGMGKN